MSQQKMSKNFIRLNSEIIQLKPELRKRSKSYAKAKNTNTGSENVEIAVNDVFQNVVGRVSKLNIKALGRVNFSADEAVFKVIRLLNILTTFDFYTCR